MLVRRQGGSCLVWETADLQRETGRSKETARKMTRTDFRAHKVTPVQLHVFPNAALKLVGG